MLCNETDFSPTVGLVLTTFNGEAFVEQALASVATQSSPPQQVVVVDDASTDDTVRQVQRWSSHLPLQIVRQARNGGVARARNVGIARLDTDLVAILDGDDVIAPDHLRVLTELHRHHGGVATPLAQFWVPGEPPRLYQRRGRGFLPPKDDQLTRLVRRNFVFVASLFSRFDFDAVGGFTEGDRCQDTTADWDLWLRLAAKGCRITAGEFPTVLYRVVAGSMADDPADLLRCEILQLERSRAYLPDHLEPTIARALGHRRAELELLLANPEDRAGQAWRAVGPGGGDWRNRARALAGAAAPQAAGRLVRRRGGW